MSKNPVAAQVQRHDLHKFHGLGNDFLIWFCPEVPAIASDLARRWCDRSTGIGADGLIIAADDQNLPRFVLFNADGGRAEVSGNGLRCFAHAIAARRGVDALETGVSTDAGTRSIVISNAQQETATASVVMGRPAQGPSLDGIDLAAIVDYQHADTVDLGNPHLVIEVKSPHAYDINLVGPEIEAHFMPTGINVHLAAKTDNGARMVTWERGAGATAACGSGACAVAAIASRIRPQQRSFEIQMPGGSATVEVAQEMTLTGPSTYVAAVEPSMGL